MSSWRGSRDPRPSARLTSLSDTIRAEGLGWLIRRIRYRTPISLPGRFIHRQLRRFIGILWAIPRSILRQLAEPKAADPDTLYAFFDLQVAQITYDAGWFAAAADRMRRQKKLARIHFVIVPGTKDGFREERAVYEVEVDTVARLWRLHNIVLPIFTLAPSFAGLTILPSRSSVQPLQAAASDRVYPAHYEPSLPVAHLPAELLACRADQREQTGILRSPTQGLRYVKRWMEPRLSGKKLITITLRNYGFMPARNSNLEAWAAFAHRLDSARYLPVFVLDTELTLDPLQNALTGFEVFREASWNVWLRMALYESSYLNLGVNTGPLFMCVLNAKTRVLIFKIITPEAPQATEEFLVKLGYRIGGQLPFASPHQRLVWEDDTLEAIEREFHRMVEQIKETSSDS